MLEFNSKQKHPGVVQVGRQTLSKNSANNWKTANNHYCEGEVHEQENLRSGQESFDEEVILTKVKDEQLLKEKEWKNRGN